MSNPKPPFTIFHYSEMANRLKFTDQLDKTLHVPESILADYDFTDEVKCGLVGCFEPHKHGIHFACVDGTESNMGKDCAAKHFPDLYDAMRKSFRARRDHRARLDVVAAYKARRDELRTTILDLWNQERGARWAHECLAGFRSHCPGFVSDQLTAMAKSGDWTIYDYREADAENALRLGFRRDEETERIPIGALQGGDILKASPYDERKSMLDRMAEYDQLTDPDSLSGRRRLQWQQWNASVNSRLDDVRKQLAAARSFFVPDNLSELIKIARDGTQRKNLRSLIDAVRRVGLTKGRRAG